MISTIELLQLGKFDSIEKKVFEKLLSGLSKRFALSFKLKGKIKDISFAFNEQRRQYKSWLLLSQLSRKATNKRGILGITCYDLYAKGLNFVFGHAAEGKASVVSLARLREKFYEREENFEKLLDRALKEAVHELGHLLGLRHHSECVMTFSNSLPEVDLKPRFFCSQCKDKLRKLRAI